MELFLDDPQGLPKFAAAMSRLSENPDDWQSEIINELLQQNPYVGDYEQKLVMNELDPEKRYALGAVMLRSKTSSNPRDNLVPLEDQGVKQVMVPVVVQEGKMFPLDVFVSNGKTCPLTERRLQQAMFRPQLFEAIGKRPGDQDLMSTLYPPYRSGGFGLGGNSYVGSHETAKTGSARMLIADILHTLRDEDVIKLASALEDDATLRSVFFKNPAAIQFFEKVAEAEPECERSDDMVKEAMSCIPPKVVQVSLLSDGFLIKTANPDALLPQADVVDRPTAESAVGQDIVSQVERNGTVTISTDAVVKDSLIDAKIGQADEFGEWKVKDKDGHELVGWVFPRCIDLDGTNMALSIFSNGSQSAFQENIAGSRVGVGANLIDEHPRGEGCFYLSRQGSAQAIIPVTVQAESQDTDGTVMYMVKTILGQDAQIRLVPGLSRITTIAEGRYGIPDDCGWLPLRNMTELAEDPNQYVKTAEARRAHNQVEVMYESGGTYSLRGLGVTKIANVLPTYFVNQDQAIYDLAILGVHPSYAKEKLAEARTLSRWVEIDGVRPVTLAAERFEKAKLAAADYLEKLPQVKSFLLKEAAALNDPKSVDTVLSIGFLNPENIGTFISYLPDFEDCLGKLSELLVASRLGLDSVDAGALERLIKHLDKVIGGLREISQHPQA